MHFVTLNSRSVLLVFRVHEGGFTRERIISAMSFYLVTLTSVSIVAAITFAFSRETLFLRFIDSLASSLMRAGVSSSWWISGLSIPKLDLMDDSDFARIACAIIMIRPLIRFLRLRGCRFKYQRARIIKVTIKSGDYLCTQERFTKLRWKRIPRALRIELIKKRRTSRARSKRYLRSCLLSIVLRLYVRQNF